MSKKIALIVGTNLHWVPFYYRYENILVKNKIPFDLIIWNREGIKEECKADKLIEYNIRDVANNKNPLKVFKFPLFSSFVKRVIKENHYGKLIFVGTYGCAIAFDCNFLSRQFRNKMWIDVRDDLYEWFKPFYNAEKKSIEASFVTTISSPAFKKFLPPHKYYFMHNLDPNYEDIIKNYKRERDPENRIRISFIGNVRYYEQNQCLLNLLKNDPRFRIQYYGNGSQPLKEFCKKNDINNVDFCGMFPQTETIKFYEKTDIINNMYGNNTMNLQLALSNKLYYGLMFNIPILVSDKTLMQELTSKYNIGYTFHNDSSFGDDLYYWYKNLQDGKKKTRFAELWTKVKTEDKETIEKLYEFLK